MGFDESFDCERKFFMPLLPKFVKKEVSLTLDDFSKIYLTGSTNNKSELGFVMLTRLPGEAVEKIRSGTVLFNCFCPLP